MPKTKTRYETSTEFRVRSLVANNPELLKKENINNLIRTVWEHYGDHISAINIFKTSGTLRTEQRLGIKR